METPFANSKAVCDIQAVIAGANAVIEDHALDTPGADYMRKIAMARVAELQAILGECVGLGLTSTIDQALHPLHSEFSAVVVALEQQLDSVVGTDLDDAAELEAALIKREDTLAALDDARVAGMLLMTHLQRVINFAKLNKSQ